MVKPVLRMESLCDPGPGKCSRERKHAASGGTRSLVAVGISLGFSRSRKRARRSVALQASCPVVSVSGRLNGLQGRIPRFRNAEVVNSAGGSVTVVLLVN